MARGTTLGVVTAAAGTAFGALSWAGARRMRRLYHREKTDLLQRTRDVVPVTRENLPAPVRHYLEVSARWTARSVRSAVLSQIGAIRPSVNGRWIPFHSEQAYSFDPPGFVWLANARMAPFLGLFARDKFVAGRGNMLIRPLGLFTVADATGPELDQAAGLRYWGEVIAVPEVVSHHELHWEAIDDRRAKMIVEHDGLKMDAVLEFGTDGLPIAFHGRRYRDVKGTAVLTPWSAMTTDWRSFNGRMFPSRWESIWHLEEGDFSAVKIENVRVEVR